MRRRVLAAMLGCALAARRGSEASAQPPADLVTDRPDQTESAVTVPRGSLQLSAGHGLNDEAPGRFVGFGLSCRVPQ